MKAAVSPYQSRPTFLYNFPNMVHWRYASMTCHAGCQLDLGFLESWTLFLRQQITDGLKGTGLVWVAGSMFCWILVKPRNVLNDNNRARKWFQVKTKRARNVVIAHLNCIVCNFLSPHKMKFSFLQLRHID
jgi:hypothetical protein